MKFAVSWSYELICGSSFVNSMKISIENISLRKKKEIIRTRD